MFSASLEPNKTFSRKVDGAVVSLPISGDLSFLESLRVISSDWLISILYLGGMGRLFVERCSLVFCSY